MTALDLETNTRELLDALALWDTRDDKKPQPAVRRAAGRAVDLIDQMSRDLYAHRRQLITEIRASDDAVMARADWMLRQREAMRETTSKYDFEGHGVKTIHTTVHGDGSVTANVPDLGPAGWTYTAPDMEAARQILWNWQEHYGQQ